MTNITSELPSLEKWREIVLTTRSAIHLQNLQLLAFEAHQGNSKWRHHLDLVEAVLADTSFEF